MSLLFGGWWYDRLNAEASALDKLLQPLKSFPVHKSTTLINRQVGFGCLLYYNTPEAVHETLPLFLEDEQILITTQGRLDNKTHLAQQLSLNIQGSYPDGFLILKAYLRWGKNCVHHLRGDWSFAIFDYKEQELFISRAPTGYGAVYYYQDHTGFYFSSSIKSILALSNYKRSLNELHFIRGLTLWDDTETAHDTYFQSIYALPLAYSLSVKDKRVTLNKHWHPENIGLKQYKNKQRYAEEMLDLFTASVNARLRSHKPVASMLSGGLDSSSVSYIAADLLKSQNTNLTTLSHVPLFKKQLLENTENQKRVLDETPFINAVVKASGNIAPILLNSGEYSVLNGLVTALDIYDAPLHGATNLYWFHDICQNTVTRGFGTLLSGEGGNSSISFEGVDYLLPFKMSNFLQHPYIFCKRQLAVPLAIKYFNRLMRWKKGIGGSLENYALNVFLQSPLIEKYNIIRDIKANNKEFYKYISDIKERKLFHLNAYNARSAAGAALGHYLGFEFRDPTTDVDLLEYFFSIPNEAFFDEHYNNRMLVKRMMKGKLPDEVLFEKRKGLQSADIVFRVKTEADEITAMIETLKRVPISNNYINIKELSSAWQLCLKQRDTQPYQIQRLLKALHFALFLQVNFD